MIFDVITTELYGWSIAAVVGDVDLATMPALRSHLTGDRSPALALDLSRVDLFDPICFGLVISAALAAKRRGASFVIVCPRGRSRELLEETALDQILTVVATTDELATRT